MKASTRSRGSIALSFLLSLCILVSGFGIGGGSVFAQDGEPGTAQDGSTDGAEPGGDDGASGGGEPGANGGGSGASGGVAPGANSGGSGANGGGSGASGGGEPGANGGGSGASGGGEPGANGGGSGANGGGSGANGGGSGASGGGDPGGGDPGAGGGGNPGTGGDPEGYLGEPAVYAGWPEGEDMPGDLVAPPEDMDADIEPFVSNQAYINEVVRLVNVERAKVGKPPLAAWYTELNSAAAVRAKEVVTHYGHTRPNGTQWFTILNEKKVSYTSAGENCAWGYATPAAVVNGWMNSPGHRANMLDEMNYGFNYIGVGYEYVSNSNYGHNWVQLFVRVPPTDATAVSLSKKSLSLKIDKTASLTASMTPKRSTNNITWSSSNPSVATVSGSGAFNTSCTVRGRTEGVAVITATARTGVIATCTVTVTADPYTISTIPGVTPPVIGKKPVSAVTATSQYTGAVSWSPTIAEGVFEGDEEYTATITLTPKTGFTASKVTENFFKVTGAAEVTNAAGSGVVTAKFPKTAAPDVLIDNKDIPLPAPVAGEAPLNAVSDEQYTGVVSWSPAVSGVFAGKTAYTATIALTPKPGYTLSGVAANSFTVTGAATVTNDADSGLVTAAFPETGFAPAARIAVSPTHAILAEPGDSADFTATLFPEGADYTLIDWDVDWSFDGTGIVTRSASGDNKTLTVTLPATPPSAGTVTVTAVYTDPASEARYAASATVELLAEGKLLPATNVRLLEKAVTVNRAKDVGGRVPILITEQDLSSFGAQSLDGMAPFSDAAGSLLIDKVALYTKKSGKLVELTTFDARMCKADDRYIEIDAKSGAKTTNNVIVRVLPHGIAAPTEDDWIEAKGLLNLAVVNKFPKVTLKTGELNLVYKGRTAPLTATSAEGACEILGIKPVAAANNGKIALDAGALRLGSASKAETIPLKVNVKIPGYKELPEANWPKLNAKVVSKAPKIKLSSGTIKLTGAYDQPLSLLSADSKRALSSWGEIEKVTLNGGAANLYRHGMVYIPGETKAATHKVNVRFKEASKAVDLKLVVKRVNLEKVTISSKTKSIVINENHKVGADIATVRISPNVSNLTISDWTVKAPPGVGYEAGPNYVKLKVDGALAATSKAFTLQINSSSMRFKTPVKISVKITKSAPSCTVSLKGKIDIANPKSMITGTVKLKNTTSDIKSVTLAGAGSEHFTTAVTGANKFAIRAVAGVPPGVKRVLRVTVLLDNDSELKVAKTISVTPKQTVGKASQSSKSVVLYKTTPLTGQAVGMSLKTPANVRLGEARINAASVNAMKFDKDLDNNGFVLKQSGINEWTIHFKDGKAPVPAKGPKLKTSYKLKIELWAEGTYEKNIDGSFKDCLRDAKGKQKSKPRVITVKVNIK